MALCAAARAGAVINATGVYAQLVAAHVGERGAATSAIETQDATLAARIDVQTHNVADLDRRLGQIDSAIEEAAKRGKTDTALSAIEGQRKAWAGLASERNEAADTSASLKAERASLVAQGRRIETEAAPIRYVAELVGAERAMRWLVALCAMLRPARHRIDRGGFGAAIHCLKPHLVRSTFDSCVPTLSSGTAPKGHIQTFPKNDTLLRLRGGGCVPGSLALGPPVLPLPKMIDELDKLKVNGR
jgi:hypothetical protein